MATARSCLSCGSWLPSVARDVLSFNGLICVNPRNLRLSVLIADSGRFVDTEPGDEIALEPMSAAWAIA